MSQSVFRHFPAAKTQHNPALRDPTLQPAPAGQHVHVTLPHIREVDQAVGEFWRRKRNAESDAQVAVFVINLFEDRLFTEGTHA